jgi:protein LSM14
MPIPVSIPTQSKLAKPVPVPHPSPPPQQSQSIQPPTTTAPSNPSTNAETIKVTTAADVQFLAKAISDTKISSTENTPGAGGYLTNPPRRRYQPPPPSALPTIASDYDFESANAKFNKEEIAKEVASTSPTSTNPSSSAADQFYDKGKSFFDNISCENRDRLSVADSTGNSKRHEERKLNIETFGVASVDSGRYRGRGGYRGGYGSWTGRGRGGGGGYRGGGGRGNWRGSSVRVNGQSTSETTTAK